MITLQELSPILAKGESESQEFKKTTAHLESIGHTLCALLNANGGNVYIGVDSMGTPIGQCVTDKTLLEVAATISNIEPLPQIDVREVALDGVKSLILLTAHPMASYRPFRYSGRPYQRTGTTTAVMSQETYHKLLMERNHAYHRFETELVQDTDLDEEEILKTAERGFETGRMPSSLGENIPTILDRLGLRINGQLTKAAIVLFGKSFLPNHTQCQLRLARFKGKDKTEFLDQNQLHGHAFFLLNEAMLFLRRHLPVKGKIPEDALERVDEPLYPIPAIREALINALCHRSYDHPGGAVSIAIFDDRLEIWSDGTLPFDITLDDLKKEHISRPRNPLITGVFYRRGLIEHWGRGTQKIIEWCKKVGLPEPEFLEQAGSVVVRFTLAKASPVYHIDGTFTPRQRLILAILSKEAELPFHEIKSRLPNPPADRTLRDDIQQLKALNLLTSYGFGRGARWLLSNNKAE